VSFILSIVIINVIGVSVIMMSAVAPVRKVFRGYNAVVEQPNSDPKFECLNPAVRMKYILDRAMYFE
jgi:hypothetical protein